MGPSAARALRALRVAVLGAVIVTVTVWTNLWFGNGPALIEDGMVAAPTLPVGPVPLARDAALASLSLIPPLWLLAAISGPWPMRLFSAAMLAAGWYWVGQSVTSQFAGNFGTTWLPGEAFAELFYVPVLTPVLWFLAVAGYVWLTGRLGPAPSH